MLAIGMELLSGELTPYNPSRSHRQPIHPEAATNKYDSK
jgi:hypothetical protein